MKRILLTCASLLAIVFGFTTAHADDHWSDDWEIKIDNDAKSAGKIGFKVSFEPEDGRHVVYGQVWGGQLVRTNEPPVTYCTLIKNALQYSDCSRRKRQRT